MPYVLKTDEYFCDKCKKQCEPYHCCFFCDSVIYKKCTELVCKICKDRWCEDCELCINLVNHPDYGVLEDYIPSGYGGYF